MNWRMGASFRPGPRNNTSPASKAADRQRAQAAGLARLEQEAKVRRDKSERLKKLREERDNSGKKQD